MTDTQESVRLSMKIVEELRKMPVSDQKIVLAVLQMVNGKRREG